jgi:hypothetical protein
MSRQGDASVISACLETVDSEQGRKRVRDLLEYGPFPHYQTHPKRPGRLVRIDESGIRTVGGFVKRRFIPCELPGAEQ